MTDGGWRPPDEQTPPSAPPPGQWAAPTAPPPGHGHLPPDPPPAPDGDGGAGRGNGWKLALVVAGISAVLLLGLVAWAGNEIVGDLDPEYADQDELARDESGAPIIPEAPPSDWGRLPATSMPEVIEAPPGADEAPFRELDCRFAGEALIEPGIHMAGAASTQQMRLQPGATFDCLDGSERSSGSIQLDASFDALSAFSGVGSGSGRIAWDQLAPSEATGGTGVLESNTGVEIQLEFPVIVVWTTILDGPYTGFRGRLVLHDWDPVLGADDVIVGVRFVPTSTTFTPL